MNISDVTKRDIQDELRLHNVSWCGRLDEVEFLKRLYPLDTLPSHDGRYRNMTGDVYQHRVNNLDWDEWWIFEDDRLGLGQDDSYLKLLCEMVHPVVRGDESEARTLVDLFNRHLVHDGWKIIEKEKISNHPVFIAISAGVAVDAPQVEEFGSEYAFSMLKKCDEKIATGDFEGAIASARSLVDAVLANVYEKTTGERIGRVGDLAEAYKKVKHTLNLSEDKYSNEAIRNILRSITSMIDGLDTLSNDMGDRHTRPVKPEKHHAQLCVNVAKTITSFLYDTLTSRFKGKESIYEQLITILNSNKRLLSYEEIMKDREVLAVYNRTDPNVRKTLVKTLIDSFPVRSFRESDVFFCVLRILRNDLNASDVKAIYSTHKENNQACGLESFINDLKLYKAELVTDTMVFPPSK